MRKKYINFALVLLLSIVVGHAQSITKLSRYTSPSDWSTHNLYNVCEISVPKTMELRTSSQSYSQTFPYNHPNQGIIAFQQKGLGNRESQAFTRYARILINYQQGEWGDFLPSSRAEAIDLETKEAMINSSTQDVHSGGGKLLTNVAIDWIDIGGIKAIRIRYRRTGLKNTTSSVTRYILQNNNKMITIIISYREQDKAYFLPDLNRVIQTFQWY